MARDWLGVGWTAEPVFLRRSTEEGHMFRRPTRVSLRLLVFLLIVGAACDARTFAQAPQSPLEGVWNGVSSEVQGKTRTFKPNEVRMVFAGDKLKATGIVTPAEQELSYSIDAKQSPKHLDCWTPERRFLCVYDLQGDTLRIAVPRGGGRPKAVSGEDGTAVLLVLRKAS